MRPPRPGRAQRGFSLVEMILALGLLGAVMISIAGLFVVGSHRVDSGRRYTLALAVGRQIQEEMSSWSFRELWGRLGISGSSTGETIDSRTAPQAAAWQSQLDAGLSQAWAEITVESIADSGSPPTIETADALRITVTVHWDERQNARTIRLATVRN